MTLYLKLGGRQIIAQAVEELPNRLPASLQAKAGSHCLPMAEKEDFVEFLVFLLGGAPYYDGTSLGQILSPVCPDNASFDLFITALAAGMHIAKLPPRGQAALQRRLNKMRPYVVDAPIKFRPHVESTAYG